MRCGGVDGIRDGRICWNNTHKVSILNAGGRVVVGDAQVLEGEGTVENRNAECKS